MSKNYSIKELGDYIMDVLTPDIMAGFRKKVRAFVKELEEKKIEKLDFYDRYDVIVATIQTYGWTYSAIKNGGDEDIFFEIYINVGYDAFICIYIDQEDDYTALPPIDCFDLPVVGQNTFIATHLEYYTLSNGYEIIAREQTLSKY